MEVLKLRSFPLALLYEIWLVWSRVLVVSVVVGLVVVVMVVEGRG